VAISHALPLEVARPISCARLFVPFRNQNENVGSKIESKFQTFWLL